MQHILTILVDIQDKCLLEKSEISRGEAISP